VRCADRPVLPPSQVAEYPLPLALHVGGTTITVALPGEVGDCEGLQTLAVPTTSLRAAAGSGQRPLATLLVGLPPKAIGGLMDWWRSMINVLQSATHSDEFFHRAAAAVVHLVGLNFGAVFLHGPDGWRPAVMPR
jgi:hypothetical protein